MEPSDELLDSFRWPTDPTADWWMLTGTELGLSLEYIKFAAAKSQLGGHDSRQNSMAAEMAGLSNLTPSQAFRIARSVGVQKLLDRAQKIAAGKAPRVTEAEIDRRIDDMIKSLDHRAAGVGIELRAKRDERSARLRDAEPAGVAEITRQLLVESGREATISVFELWHTVATNLMDCPFFALLAPIVRANYPDLWQRYRSPMAGRVEFFKGSEHEQRILAEFDAAGAAPEPTDAEFQEAIGKTVASPGSRRVNGSAAPEQQAEAEESHAP
jgi:hypothetical protein